MHSFAIPLTLALLAPLTVVFCLVHLRSFWWTLALYQVCICLCLPALVSLVEGRAWRGHIALLGLRRTETGGGKWVKAAPVLGLVTGLVTAGVLILVRDSLLDPARLDAVLTGWGVGPDRLLAMLAVMVVFNAVSEELFWRGFLPGYAAEIHPSSAPPFLLTVVVPAILYTSYHAFTIGRLVAEPGGVVLMTSGILGAGLLWGWLRQRSGSVWPALMSHFGAVVAYLAVQYRLTSGGGN